MNAVKAIVGLLGTVVIAGWVAYAISTPRNFENAMNDPVAALDGTSVGAELSEQMKAARSEQCARFTAMASEAWDKAVDNDTLDRDQAKLDEYDRQAARYCA